MMKSIILVLIVLLLIMAEASVSGNSAGLLLQSSQSNSRPRAPELSSGHGWLNTDKPLSLAGLKGKIVLLDFWTYGCINCMHIIPDLKKLEQKYANQLVVIGVHSGKFENEKQLENIRRILLRYAIEHPVVNDSDFAIWDSYEVKAWPTRVLIDPAGYFIGAVPGEGNFDPIDQAIAKTIVEFRKRGELNEQPLRLALERAKVGDLPLAFPGKVLADGPGDRLFIADSNHNRIVVTKLDGTLIDTIGSGERGARNGSFTDASFYRPQGMAVDNDTLYVADTENHLIRRVDLKSRSVETIAGTGQLSFDKGKSGLAMTVGLNSPWDLQLLGRSLFIAMAGPHQIWRLDLNNGQISTFAGSGREGRRDGALNEATFAQPSGITTDGKLLYTADSEANIVRAIDPQASSVRTLVGADLFGFGDVDGYGNEVRLQHPLGIVAHNDKLLIADTYNHKIKQLDPKSREVKTFRGNGKPGQKDGGSPTFYEPGGLSVANNKLYVADTNNHAIRIVDLDTKETSTLKLKGLEPPEAPSLSESTLGPKSEEIKLELQRLPMGKSVLSLNIELPEGYHLNPAAAQRYRVSVENDANTLKIDHEAGTVSAKGLKFPVSVPFQAVNNGTANLLVQLTLVYCREDNTGTCKIKSFLVKVPVQITEGASGSNEIKIVSRLES